MIAPRRRAAFSSLLLLVLVCGFALAGCGKKGAPEPPPGVPNTYPQPYPRA